MAQKVNLSVNYVPIKLIPFVQDYIAGIISGIIGSLRDTGEIRDLKLSLDNEGQIAINLNGADVPLKVFPNDIIKSTVLGMISPLKGVGEVNRLEITISQ